MRKLKKGEAYIDVISGVEGPCLSIGDGETGHRIAGKKPWGGGKTLHRFIVDIEKLKEVLKSHK